MINEDDLFSDEQALMINDDTGETVITFLEVNESDARLMIYTVDGTAFMLRPNQIKAIRKKLDEILSKEKLQ